MKAIKKIILLSLAVAGFILSFVNTGCRVQYKFNDASIPDTIKTIKINFFENKARYINPQLSPRLTDKLRQKFISQTRYTQTNNDDADWIIDGYISEYSFSTSAISGQREAANRLTVAVHFTITGGKVEQPLDYDVTRNFEFSASQSLQQAEANLLDEMIRGLTDDIFNRLFSQW